jgi:hypothetical protein
MSGVWGVSGVVVQVGTRPCVAVSDSAGGTGVADQVAVHQAQTPLRLAPRITAGRPSAELPCVEEHRRGADARARSCRPARRGRGVPVGAPRPGTWSGLDFSLPDKPNQVWVGDLTEIPNNEGGAVSGQSLGHCGLAFPAGRPLRHGFHDAEIARAACAWRLRSAAGRVGGMVFHTARALCTPANLFASACAQTAYPFDRPHGVGSLQRGRGGEYLTLPRRSTCRRGRGSPPEPGNEPRSPGYLEEYTWSVGTPLAASPPQSPRGSNRVGGAVGNRYAPALAPRLVATWWPNGQPEGHGQFPFGEPDLIGLDCA